MDRWPALVNVIMNLWFSKTRGISGLAEELLASQEGVCSMELELVMLFVSSYPIFHFFHYILINFNPYSYNMFHSLVSFNNDPNNTL
jgi:hypothetical protein